MIDHIITKTKVQKITYVGHSQGTTQLFAAMTIMPEYFEKNLNGFIALAPVVRQTNIPGVALGTAAKDYLDDVLNWMGVNSILGMSDMTRYIDGFACGKVEFLCIGLLKIVSDGDSTCVDPSRLQVFMSHYPTGSSLKCLRHIAKNVRAKRFQQFDYGKKDNLIKYGTETPPEYNLSKIRNKICLLAGEADLMVDIKDTLWLKEQLKGMEGILTLYKSYKEYGHSAYTLAKDPRFLVDALHCAESFNK